MKDTEILRDIFLRAKSDVAISHRERQEIQDVFWGPIEVLDCYSIRAYALLFPCEVASMERYKEIFDYFWVAKAPPPEFDDNMGAVIVSVCNYWNAAEDFETQLRSVLDLWDWEEQSDTCIRSASHLALLAYSSRSRERFDYIKSVALRRYESADAVERSVLIDAVIVSTIGNLASPEALRARLCDKAALADFGFAFE